MKRKRSRGLQNIVLTLFLFAFCVHLANPPREYQLYTLSDAQYEAATAPDELRRNPRWNKEQRETAFDNDPSRELAEPLLSPLQHGEMDGQRKQKSRGQGQQSQYGNRQSGGEILSIDERGQDTYARMHRDEVETVPRQNRQSEKAHTPDDRAGNNVESHAIVRGNFSWDDRDSINPESIANGDEERAETPDGQPSANENLVNERSDQDFFNKAYADLSAPVADWDYFPDIQEQSVKEPILNLNPKNCSNPVLDTAPPRQRPPSQGACDGYDGILHIQQGDWGGASGTIFFQYMVGFLYWADQHNFKPWVHLNNFSAPVFDEVVHNQGPGVRFTMMKGMEVGWARDARDPRGYVFPGKPSTPDGMSLISNEYFFEGTGVWEHYFEPVSDFSPGDPSCMHKPLVSLDYLQISHYLHYQAPWASHAWRYWMPDYMLQKNVSLEAWFKPQRYHAAAIVQRYIRFNADMEQRAACAHPNPENSLGMHIRHGDKWIARYIIPPSDFLPYCEAFVDNGGSTIYLATDSALVIEEIMRDWPERITSRIVRQQSVKGLSRNESAAFNLGVPAHQTNVEALTDALALSKCSYLLHGLSALTEAAFYMNPALVHRSINLEELEDEDNDHMTAHDFAMVLGSFPVSNEPTGPVNEYVDMAAPLADWDYFPDIQEQSVKEPILNLDPKNCSNPVLDTSPPRQRPPSKGACNGYDGILHIQQGDFGGGSGTIFFQYMVAFLYWADQHNFKPWVHLNNFSAKVFDEVVHNQGPGVRFTMMKGMSAEWARDARDPHGYLFPGKPVLPDDMDLTPDEYFFEGTGVWEHYFEPVSDFSPGDPSCVHKPLVSLHFEQISQGLHCQSPWASHAWRYWMPDYMRQTNVSLEAWFEPQRRHAAKIVTRYIRFNPDMEQRAACAHPNPENSLGMHIRHGDKWIARYIIPPSDFLPYCEAFVDNGGSTIYLATDSALVIEEIMRDWPERITSRIVRQQSVKGLSRNESAAFNLGVPAHQTNVEALTDALALSKCSYLLHGLSALTEAAFYMNPALVHRSISLEEVEDIVHHRIRVRTFGQVVRNASLSKG